MSYTNLNYHIVFATKGRRPFLSPQHMPRVREYIGGIVRELRGRMLAANGPADHLHVALTADASTALADLVRTIKSNSSRWIRRTLPGLARFGWQDGYSAFSVSHSGVGKVVAYVQSHRADPAPFDVFMPTGDPDLDPGHRARNAAIWEAAGLTWWGEDLGPWRWQADPAGPWPLASMRDFVRRGPART